MAGETSGSSFDVGTAQHLEGKGSLHEDRKGHTCAQRIGRG